MLGHVVATPGALDALHATATNPWFLLKRHVTGDFGDVPYEDAQENILSIKKGFRILSSYTLLDGDTSIWLITEADRSATTFLLPSEY
jgi:hypothetical protein